jgi:hypothetical protein
VFACSAGGPGFDSRLRRINRVSQRTVASEQRMLSDALCRGCRWPWSSPYNPSVQETVLFCSRSGPPLLSHLYHSAQDAVLSVRESATAPVHKLKMLCLFKNLQPSAQDAVPFSSLFPFASLPFLLRILCSRTISRYCISTLRTCNPIFVPCSCEDLKLGKRRSRAPDVHHQGRGKGGI